MQCIRNLTFLKLLFSKESGIIEASQFPYDKHYWAQIVSKQTMLVWSWCWANDAAVEVALLYVEVVDGETSNQYQEN